MDPVAALTRLGGFADRRALLELTTARELRVALDESRVTRARHGRYCLPHDDQARAAAERLAGALALRSAVLRHGWELKAQPALPEVAVRPKRKLPAQRRTGARVLWLPLSGAELAAGVTSPVRTVLDCARLLPFDEALAIADSALRSGRVTIAQLRAVPVRGAGAAKVRRVLHHADRRAANVFESVLRALCVEVGLDVVPQQPIDLGPWTCHPDLVDARRRLVVEADSHTFHTESAVFAADCERYNRLVLLGWLVLRFTWHQVMREPAYVRWALHAAAGSGRPDDRGPRLARAA